MGTPTEAALSGRVAVVTGAGVRLGQALALGLAARGARVVVHYAHSAEGAAETVRVIEAAGGVATSVQADLTRSAEVARVFEVADGWGGCDLLVNSAAVFERRPLEQIDDEAWRRVLDTDLTAPFYCCRAAVPAMRRKGRGDIVNLLDVAGALMAWRGYSHYAAAKAGLAMLTRCLALELAPVIRVNGVAPGPVLLPEAMPESERERALAQVPLGREGSAQDVVEAVAYLVTAPYVTGHVLAVDGGRSA